MHRYRDYTLVWNALDYSATIFPVTTVDPTLDVKNPPHKFYDDLDKRIYEMCEHSARPLGDYTMTQ